MGHPQFTDAFFARAIADLSSNNTLHFTPKQLLYFLDLRLKRKRSMKLLTFCLVYLILSIIVPKLAGGFLSIFLGAIAFPMALIIYNLVWIATLFASSRSPNVARRFRRESADQLLALGLCISVLGPIYSFLVDSFIIFIIAAGLGLTAVWLGYVQRRQLRDVADVMTVKNTQIQTWLDNWKRANGSVTNLLPAPVEALLPSQSVSTPDVTAYSFDRVVVCQSDAIAQMLIVNHFHFENNCAILSISGYPQSVFDTAMRMLRRNPNLMVFVFHDCSPEGVMLVHQLRTDVRWFPDNSTVIVDVGLSPRQVLTIKRELFVQNSKASAQAAAAIDPGVRQNVSEVELQWLEAGNFVELESFTPQRLIHILNRSIATGQEIETQDSGLIFVGDGGSFYTTESFG